VQNTMASIIATTKATAMGIKLIILINHGITSKRAETLIQVAQATPQQIKGKSFLQKYLAKKDQTFHLVNNYL
jgi:hypothetical protein